MKHALVLGATLFRAFANANAGSKLYISPTPAPNDLLLGDFAAITDWLEIRGIGSRGETGSNTNILTYDTWDTIVIQKAKGMTDAGSPEVELARMPDDPGQLALNAAALTNFNYAIREVRNDARTLNGTPTIIYNRGLVSGPRRPGGRNEDFDLEIFTFGLQQREIVVNPSAGGNPPLNTVAPTITGDAEVGETLTVTNGTFTGDATINYTYQWFAGGVAIAGANANTFLLTSAQLGRIITARVTAQNASGVAMSTSAATAAVIS